MPAMTPDEIVDKYLPELAALTSMQPVEWTDFFALTPEQQIVAAENYRDADWKRSPDTFGKVMTVLEIIGAVAGVVAGVAGAATAVNALKLL